MKETCKWCNGELPDKDWCMDCGGTGITRTIDENGVGYVKGETKILGIKFFLKDGTVKYVKAKE
jgi:hypothetical protein